MTPQLNPRAAVATALLALAATAQAAGPMDAAATPAPAAQALQALAEAAAASPLATQRYIVVLSPATGRAADVAQALLRPLGLVPGHVYEHALKGFAIEVPTAVAGLLMQALARHPLVQRVEPDAQVRAIDTQPGATWGLDRSDQRSLPLSGSYTYRFNGAGVKAYVIDTGILPGHVDFGGRVVAGYTAINDGNGSRDCNGHGTHVAGTLGGATWGMAKGVTLVPVRVLGCNGSGSNSGVIAGMDWVAANHQGPGVVNMSLGGSASSATDAAVANLVGRGITVVVAAGNENTNACNGSPARAPSAITVGATTASDARASYSNFGSCLDVFAPGSNIMSAWHTSTTATATLSGTSMASPHVAGLAALMLQSAPALTPAEVDQQIKATATPGLVSGAGAGSPNLLIYQVVGGTAEPPPPTPVTSVSVGGLSGSGRNVSGGWQATVTVTVRSAAGAAVAGATVSGNFSAGGTGRGCVTAANGQCAITSANVGAASTTFTVTGLSGPNMAYDPGRNTASSVTVNQPRRGLLGF